MSRAPSTTIKRSTAVWWAVDSTPLHGCQLCDFGRDLATEPQHVGVLCRHPSVARPQRPVQTEAARKQGGTCGPEAMFLTIKGVQL